MFLCFRMLSRVFPEGGTSGNSGYRQMGRTIIFMILESNHRKRYVCAGT